MWFEGFKSTLWSQKMVRKQLIFGKNKLNDIFAIENIKFINYKA